MPVDTRHSAVRCEKTHFIPQDSLKGPNLQNNPVKSVWQYKQYKQDKSYNDISLYLLAGCLNKKNNSPNGSLMVIYHGRIRYKKSPTKAKSSKQV